MIDDACPSGHTLLPQVIFVPALPALELQYAAAAYYTKSRFTSRPSWFTNSARMLKELNVDRPLPYSPRKVCENPIFFSRKMKKKMS
jgi:hypothetical protein